MSKHILLCDDELPIIRAAEIKLSRAGYRVTCCCDGVQALDVIGRDKPDLMITDCQMPRMGGIELIQRLRDRPETHDLPIMMLTGKGYELQTDELRDRWNVLRVIAKPFSPREVLQFVESALTAGAV